MGEVALKQNVLELVQRGEFTGLSTEITNEQYHAAPGLSFTGMKRFAETPATYSAYLREEKAPTDDQRLGSLVHMRVLEPEVFKQRVVEVDGVWSHKTKEKVLELRAAGQFPAKPKEIELSKVMAESILKREKVRNLLAKGAAEVSCFWKEPIEVTDPSTGEVRIEEILCKARPDWLRTEDGIIADIKWYNDLADLPIRKQIYRQKYHWQAQWYLHGLSRALGKKLNLFVHIFIQEKDPYLVRTVALPDAVLEKAHAEFAPLLPRFLQCLKANDWPGYPDQIEMTNLPDYAWSDWS